MSVRHYTVCSVVQVIVIIKLIVVRIVPVSVGRLVRCSIYMVAGRVSGGCNPCPAGDCGGGGSGTLLCFEFLQVKTDLFLESARARGGAEGGPVWTG